MDFLSGFGVPTKQDRDANKRDFCALQPNSSAWASRIGSKLKPGDREGVLL